MSDNQPIKDEPAADEGYEEEEVDLDRELMASHEVFAEMSDLLNEMPTHLDAEADLAILKEADANLEKEAEHRETVLDTVRDDLRKLSQTYTEARASSSRPASHPSPAEHERQMLELEDQQLSTAKQVNEETLHVGKKEAELARLRDELRDVEAWDVEKEGSGGLDSRVIRLKLFKELGFTLVPGEEGSDSLLIRNELKNDINSVPIDRSKPKFYQANLFWNLASE